MAEEHEKYKHVDEDVGVIVTEFTEKVHFIDEEVREAGDLKDNEKPVHHGFVEKFLRSDSSSSSSGEEEEDEREGAEKKKKKKGKKHVLHLAGEEDDAVEVDKCDVMVSQEVASGGDDKKGFLEKIKEKLPGHHVKKQEGVSPPPPSPRHVADHDETRKGILEKIKEKIPGCHSDHGHHS